MIQGEGGHLRAVGERGCFVSGADVHERALTGCKRSRGENLRQRWFVARRLARTSCPCGDASPTVEKGPRQRRAAREGGYSRLAEAQEFIVSGDSGVKAGTNRLGTMKK